MRTPLVALLILIVALLVLRAANRDRHAYARFKRLTATRARQRVMARWLRESFLLFTGLTLLVLLAAWDYVPLVARHALAWGPLAQIASGLATPLGRDIAAAVAVLFVVLLVVPVFLLRRRIDEISSLGDIGSLLPRTRGELRFGAGLAVNAGVLEELLFRLAMPALIFGIIGNGVLSFVIASALFGVLHLYQGVWGMLGATILGLVFSAVFLLSGSILIVIVVHVLIDLRSLVLIPVVIGCVHRIEGDVDGGVRKDAAANEPPGLP